jgi:hypothetical protein
MSDFISKPFSSDKDISPGLGYILKYIKLRVDNHKNFMCVVIGSVRSGKSYSVLGMMEVLYPDKPKQWIVDHIHFTPKLFLDGISNENTFTGETFSFDESGVGQNSKNWQSLINKMINFMLQTFGYKNLAVFFCLPNFTFLDSDTRKLVHAIFETKRIDKKTSSVLLSPKFTQINHTTGKMYSKYLRVKHNGVLTPIKLISIPKPSQELIDLYELKKRAYTKELYENIMLKAEMFEMKENKKIRQRDKLTEHQMNVLKAYQKYGTQMEIAKNLSMSPAAVSCAIRFIKKKLEVYSTEDLKHIDLSTL